MSMGTLLVAALATTTAGGDGLAGIVPIEFDRSGLPMIEMDLDGKPERVYLDTGTRFIHLPRETAGRIAGLRTSTGGGRAIDLGGATRKEEAFAIPAPILGGRRVPGEIEGRYLTKWGVGRSEFELPVLGLDLLIRGEFLLDFPNGRLVVWDFGTPAPVPFTVDASSPLEIRPEGVILSVPIDGRDRRFVVDSGASLSFVKRSVTFENDEIRPCPPEMLDGKCEIVEHAVSFGTAGVRLRMIRMDLPDAFPADGVVGGDLLRSCAIHVDARSKRLNLSCPAR